ncbi:phosphate acetyltransferase, partial [Paraburkholderia sp. BR14261]
MPSSPDKYSVLLARCGGLAPVPTAVAHPCDVSSLTGALDAANLGLIVPILVGPEAKIRAVAEEADLRLDGITIIDAPHSHAAAEFAVRAVREGQAELLM